MKKLLIFLIFTAFSVFPAFSADTGGTSDQINRLVKEKMDAISKTGGSSQNVKELQMKKGSGIQEKTTVIDGQKKFNMQELAMTNITGGIFEGAVIGAGCGLIGYGRTNNRDITPVINGSVYGLISGAVLASALSIVQANTGKYYASDDYGINLIQWVAAGAAAGGAVGYFTYGSLKNTEVITENTGYGIAGGALTGLIFATIEFMLPSELRGKTGSGRAEIIPSGLNNLAVVYSVKY